MPEEDHGDYTFKSWLIRSFFFHKKRGKRGNIAQNSQYFGFVRANGNEGWKLVWTCHVFIQQHVFLCDDRSWRNQEARQAAQPSCYFSEPWNHNRTFQLKGEPQEVVPRCVSLCTPMWLWGAHLKTCALVGQNKLLSLSSSASSPSKRAVFPLSCALLPLLS